MSAAELFRFTAWLLPFPVRPQQGLYINSHGEGPIFQKSFAQAIFLKEMTFSTAIYIQDLMCTRPCMMDPYDEIPTRRSLLTRLKNWGDDHGWQTFFDTYWRLIYSAAIKSGLTDPEAQDVVQETVLSVSKSMRRAAYQAEKGSFKNWLLRMTRWQVNRQWRKKYQDARLPRHQPRNSTSTRTGTVERVAAPESVSFEEVWEEEWEQNLLELALQRVRATVDARQYQIFDLYVVKEWPVSRVSQALQVTPARVYMIKHRVGRMLKKELSRLRAKPI